MRLNELNYAPEIANAMLKTQAAGALLEARADANAASSPAGRQRGGGGGEGKEGRNP